MSLAKRSGGSAATIRIPVLGGEAGVGAPHHANNPMTLARLRNPSHPGRARFQLAMVGAATSARPGTRVTGPGRLGTLGAVPVTLEPRGKGAPLVILGGQESTDRLGVSEAQEKTDRQAGLKGQEKTDPHAASEGQEKTDHQAASEGQGRTDPRTVLGDQEKTAQTVSGGREKIARQAVSEGQGKTVQAGLKDQKKTVHQAATTGTRTRRNHPWIPPRKGQCQQHPSA